MPAKGVDSVIRWSVAICQSTSSHDRLTLAAAQNREKYTDCVLVRQHNDQILEID